jgi:hypothetical protein
MPDERCYWAAVTAAIHISDVLGPLPGLERPFLIGKLTFLLLDQFKRHDASGISFATDVEGDQSSHKAVVHD